MAYTVKNCLQRGKPRFDPWVGKIPLEKGIATHPSILAWKMSHTEPTGAAKARLSNWHTHTRVHTHMHTHFFKGPVSNYSQMLILWGTGLHHMNSGGHCFIHNTPQSKMWCCPQMKGKKLSGKQEQQRVPTLLICTLIVAQMCLPSPNFLFILVQFCFLMV